MVSCYTNVQISSLCIIVRHRYLFKKKLGTSTMKTQIDCFINSALKKLSRKARKIINP